MQIVKLNNGVQMPVLGFGVFQVPAEGHADRNEVHRRIASDGEPSAPSL